MAGATEAATEVAALGVIARLPNATVGLTVATTIDDGVGTTNAHLTRAVGSTEAQTRVTVAGVTATEDITTVAVTATAIVVLATGVPA